MKRLPAALAICLMTCTSTFAQVDIRNPSIDTETAPALALLSAADMAQMLQLQDLRKTWIQEALAKPAPFADRMAMGMLLVTRLQEIEMGKKVFADAFGTATDDEQRANVRWFEAEATRMREDLEDGAYFSFATKLY